nr:RTD [Cucurbit aphid-borne yellows virus]
MYKWEDEKWDKVNLQAGYSRNDRRCMETYLTIPADKGKFHVYLEADGEFVVKHIGGELDGSWLGNIAYDVSQRGWNIGNYKGCKIKNYQSNTTFVAGHPDATMNSKSFDSARAVEVDWYASFELECDDEEGSWAIYPPPIQKDSSYNYTVSYGNYTEKYCEWGAISVSIDEDNNGSAPRRIPRKGAMAWSTPEPSFSGDESQRQDFKTPSPEERGSDALESEETKEEENLLDRFEEENIPDADDEDIWKGISRGSETGTTEDDRASTSSRLRGNLKPQGLPKPQPTRTITKFEPNPDLIEAWRPDLAPGYSKADVAAATVIAGGSIHEGRDMLRRRDEKVMDSRKKWGILSSASSLTSGSLKKLSAQSEKLAKLTTGERAEFERIKNSHGKTVAAEYLEMVLADKTS